MKIKTTKDSDSQVEDAVKNKKIKTMIDFDNDCNSIKSIIVSGNTTVDVSTRFIKGKMLMFAKVSLKSFVYDIIDVFSFPDEKVRAAYNQYDIQECFLYLNLTDTDSCSMFFVFICSLYCDVKKSEFRKIMFEILKKSKIAKRLDRSDDFWKQSAICDENTKNVMGLYEIENIDNPNISTITINPKEYFEKFKNRKNNKKHKGVRRDTPGMNFESYAKNIFSIRQIDIAHNDKKTCSK